LLSSVLWALIDYILLLGSLAFMYTSRIYRHSPALLQNALVSARGYAVRVLQNLTSGAAADDIVDSQWLDSDALAQLQLKRLQALVHHAAVHVPYYRESFAAAGFAPEQLLTLADMQRLPVLTKLDVVQAGERLLTDNSTAYRFSSVTSGTTGTPIKLWRDLHAINREKAFIARQCHWAGVKLGERRLWLRGDKIVASDATQPPFWRYNKADNTILMSSFHLSERNAQAYIQAMETFDPVFGMAYSSSLAFLARYLLNKRQRYRGKSLKCFITSSETLTHEQHQLITQAFGCRIFDWYGSSERVSAMGTCEYGNYHLLSDYGFTELIPQDNGTHTLMGTGFDNLLMPLIRYSLDDEVVLAESDYSCPCLRAFPVIEQVIGRTADYLIKPDGSKVFMACMLLDKLDHVLESQIRQDKPDEVRILLVLSSGNVVNEQQVVALAQELLGKVMRIKVEQVKHIPKSTTGKFSAVVRSL
jgi:phenylacetate-CoA ligase